MPRANEVTVTLTMQQYETLFADVDSHVSTCDDPASNLVWVQILNRMTKARDKFWERAEKESSRG